MRRFAALFAELDATTSTNAKVEAMRRHLAAVPPADAAWAVWFLSGRRPKRLIKAGDLAGWAAELAGIPEWLFRESYAAVGDLAETAALLVVDPTEEAGQEPSDPGDADVDADVDLSLHRWMEERILPLRGLDPAAQRERVVGWWRALPAAERFVLNKLVTGGFRVGVSRSLVARALAEVAGLPPAAIAHRLMGDWSPSAELFERLVAADGGPGSPEADLSRPYPFFLASPFEGDPAELGGADEWIAEWKWDGIRAQVIRRGGEVFVWSRGEELMTDRFPEISQAARLLPPGTVLDGEVTAWRDGPLPFAVLQRRIGRKRVSERLRSEAPVAFVAYDLLEEDGEDLRETSLAERRERLAALLDASGPVPGFLLSDAVEAAGWDDLAAARATSRERGVEGLMLKRLASPYRTGRRRGDWWKWKVDPFTVDAVMVYAQAGHGRRASLFTDYTFAVWRGDELVPVAKAYSGLDDAEILVLDRWIRRHTREKFGPVRSVEPVQVFELAFEGIARSTRHKSGIALRFPRIARWRQDKPPEEADPIEALEALLDAGRREDADG